MRYLDFLERVHEVLEPPTYLEIGIRHGDSLALALGTSVATPDEIQAGADQIAALLKQVMPAEWQRHDSSATISAI